MEIIERSFWIAPKRGSRGLALGLAAPSAMIRAPQRACGVSVSPVGRLGPRRRSQGCWTTAPYRCRRDHQWRRPLAPVSASSGSIRRRPTSRPCSYTRSIAWPFSSSSLITAAGESSPAARNAASDTGCSPAHAAAQAPDDAESQRASPNRIINTPATPIQAPHAPSVSPSAARARAIALIIERARPAARRASSWRCARSPSPSADPVPPTDQAWIESLFSHVKAGVAAPRSDPRPAGPPGRARRRPPRVQHDPASTPPRRGFLRCSTRTWPAP